MFSVCPSSAARGSLPAWLRGALCSGVVGAMMTMGCGGGPIPPDVVTVAAGLDNPTDVVVLDDGSLLVAESGAGRVVRVSDAGEVSPLIDGFALGTFFPYDIGPLAVAVRGDGSLVVGEGGESIGRERVSFFAGDGSDAGVAALVPISGGDFRAVVIEPAGGDLYIASASTNRVFRAAAGGGGFGEPAAFVADTTLPPIGFDSPWALAIDADGNLLIGFADVDAGGIARLATSGGDEAGSAEMIYTSARMVTGIAVRPADGVVFFSEFSAARPDDARIARFRDGQVETFFGGDLVGPTSIAFGQEGELYVTTLGATPNADSGSVLRLTPVTIADTSDSETGTPGDASPPPSADPPATNGESGSTNGESGSG